MKIIAYDRKAAVEYARKWAYGRNPQYYNFDSLGGDCTNYVSQCLHAGGAVMNYRPVTGWFYRSANDRTASWTGVEYIYRFLTENDGLGPFGQESPVEELQEGDLVQLGRDTGDFYHTPILVGFARASRRRPHLRRVQQTSLYILFRTAARDTHSRRPRSRLKKEALNFQIQRLFFTLIFRSSPTAPLRN